MKLLTPKGTEIIGELDTVQCRADISSFYVEDDGTLGIDWDGNTEIFWDEQRPILEHGKLLFLDEDGESYTLDQLQLVDDDGNIVPLKGTMKDGKGVSDLIKNHAR